MSQLVMAGDSLNFFFDESGHEKPDPKHTPFYAVGGCAVMGADYERLIGWPWTKVRMLVGGHERAQLHAADFGVKPSHEHLEVVSNFFGSYQFMRVAAAGSVKTLLPDGVDLMPIVMGTLKQRMLDVLKWTKCRAVNVVFESNDRANHLVEAYFGDLRFNENGVELPIDFHFMPKSSGEVALEVADFVVNAVGGQARRAFVEKKPGFRKDFEAVFHTVDRRLVSFMGIEEVSVGGAAQPAA